MHTNHRRKNKYKYHKSLHAKWYKNQDQRKIRHRIRILIALEKWHEIDRIKIVRDLRYRLN